MKHLSIAIALIPLLMPHVVLADEVTPDLVVMEETEAEDPPLDRPFIEIETPVLWEDTKLAPERSTARPAASQGIVKLTNPDGVGHRFPSGQCTFWAASKRKIVFRGHAKDWLVNGRKAGYKTGHAPVVGSTVVTAEHPVYGHVAHVESVDVASRTFVISEMNYAGLGVVTRRTLRFGDRRIVGFLY